MFKSLRIALCVLLVAGVSCNQQAPYRQVQGVMLGTTLQLVASTPLSEGELYGQAMALDKEAKASMSVFDHGSLLNRLNRGETDSVDYHIARNIALADSISRLSNGAYDITVGPLVRAWGFAGSEAEQQPNIDSILAFVGYEKLRIEEGRLVKADPRMALDLNSIAKGYTVDLLGEWLEAQGVESYLVDIGGEIRCRGNNRQGGPWRIGIETPYDGNMTNGESLTARIALHDGALATSGNYRRFYLDAEGNKVAHTIDPKSGYSRLSRLLSATVVAPTCGEADALCTMLMAMGDQAALTFVAAHPEMAVYLILAGEGERDYDEVWSSAMQQLRIE